MNTVDLLKSIPYFSELSRDALEAQVADAEIIHLNCGQSLLEQGDVGDQAFILLDGRLRSLRDTPDEGTVVLGEIGKGEIVGEMAALMGSPRNSTVVALRNSVLMTLSGERLVELLQKQKGSLIHLARTIAHRSSKSYVAGGQVGSVLLVPVTPGIDMEGFSREFCAALHLHLPAKVLSPAILQEEKGFPVDQESGISHAELNAVLAMYEDQVPLMVYQAGESWNTWVHCCAGRVDKVILVADAGQSPEPGGFERQLMDMLAEINHVPTELALLHPSRERIPSQTRKWLENRTLSRHHHLVKQDLKSYQKLARFLTGNAIGVALSGGGFKSSMQTGILQAMAEADIPVDILGGSSGGAMAGASFGMITDVKEFSRMIDDCYRQFKGVKSFTFPMVSVFSGKKFTSNFTELFRDIEVEDLWTSYFCLSLSLVTGDLIVHEDGPLWRAVRASSSVMGLVPPVIHNNDCLVDGGFINPCPSNILTRKGAGKVVVINARSPSGIRVGAQYPPTVSGWNLLFKKLNPFFKQKISPSIGTNIIQSMFIASDHLLRQVYAESKIDLFISPSIAHISSSDGEAIKELYRFGYEYGQKEAEKWKAELGLLN